MFHFLLPCPVTARDLSRREKAWFPPRVHSRYLSFVQHYTLTGALATHHALLEKLLLPGIPTFFICNASLNLTSFFSRDPFQYQVCSKIAHCIWCNILKRSNISLTYWRGIFHIIWVFSPPHVSMLYRIILVSLPLLNNHGAVFHITRYNVKY